MCPRLSLKGQKTLIPDPVPLLIWESAQTFHWGWSCWALKLRIWETQPFLWWKCWFHAWFQVLVCLPCCALIWFPWYYACKLFSEYYKPRITYSSCLIWYQSSRVSIQYQDLSRAPILHRFGTCCLLLEWFLLRQINCWYSYFEMNF